MKYKIHKRIFLSVIFLFAFIVSVSFVSAVTSVSSCGPLSAPGETYVLTANIVNHAGTCFTINANGITLDGQGFSIDGDDVGEDYGVLAIGRSGLTIKNLGASDFLVGIYLITGSNSLISASTATSNSIGIRLSGSGNTIQYNLIQ